MKRVKLPNGFYVERDNDGSFYYGNKVLVNRISAVNLDNMVEPQRTWIKDAIEELGVNDEKD